VNAVAQPTIWTVSQTATTALWTAAIEFAGQCLTGVVILVEAVPVVPVIRRPASVSKKNVYLKFIKLAGPKPVKGLTFAGLILAISRILSARTALILIQPA
jgi:hypothetical protein